MTKNVASWDRVGRGVMAAVMLTCAVMAPFSLPLRLAVFALPALYVAFTALAGTCLGYRLMGYSTCPISTSGAR